MRDIIRSEMAMRPRAATPGAWPDNLNGKEVILQMENTTATYDFGSTPTGYIYAIQSTTTKLIKIGFSVMPEGRLKGLQTGSPDKLELLGTWPGTMRDEKSIHRRLKQHRKHGEWFDIDFKRAAFVIDVYTHKYDVQDGVEYIQRELNRAMEVGLSVRIVEQTSKDGKTPILAIQLWNVAICQTHKIMHSGQTCPMC